MAKPLCALRHEPQDGSRARATRAMGKVNECGLARGKKHVDEETEGSPEAWV
jgi:hypothetical protein